MFFSVTIGVHPGCIKCMVIEGCVGVYAPLLSLVRNLFDDDIILSYYSSFWNKILCPFLIVALLCSPGEKGRKQCEHYMKCFNFGLQHAAVPLKQQKRHF